LDKIIKYVSVNENKERSMKVSITAGKRSNIEKYVSIFDECKQDAYISHGEVLCGRATHDLKWADDILSQMRQEFNDYLSDTNRFSVFEILLCGEIAGFAILEIDRQFKTAQIHDIIIKKDFQGKGVGAEAIRVIEEYLKKENIGMILLESGIQNKNAHDFFEKNGYTQISVEFAKRLD
jgi:ribosomal protein S18 acetylase RimI-like enzyme